MTVLSVDAEAVHGSARRLLHLVEALAGLAAQLTSAREARTRWWGPHASRWDLEVALTAAAAQEVGSALQALAEACLSYRRAVEQAQDELRRLEAQLATVMEQHSRALFLWAHDDPVLRGSEPDAGPLVAALHWGREQVEARAVADARTFAAALEAVPLHRRLPVLQVVADSARLLRATWTHVYALPLGLRGPVRLAHDGLLRGTATSGSGRIAGPRLQALDRALGRAGPLVSLSVVVENGNGSARSRLDKTMAVLDLVGLLLTVTPAGAARVVAWRGAVLTAEAAGWAWRAGVTGRGLQGTAAAWTSGATAVDLARRVPVRGAAPRPWSSGSSRLGWAGAGPPGAWSPFAPPALSGGPPVLRATPGFRHVAAAAAGAGGPGPVSGGPVSGGPVSIGGAAPVLGPVVPGPSPHAGRQSRPGTARLPVVGPRLPFVGPRLPELQVAR